MDFLKEIPARYSQNLINRVANILSDRPRTTVPVYGNWAINRGEDTGLEMYTLGETLRRKGTQERLELCEEE